jgi:hypothetical protein
VPEPDEIPNDEVLRARSSFSVAGLERMHDGKLIDRCGKEHEQLAVAGIPIRGGGGRSDNLINSEGGSFARD